MALTQRSPASAAAPAKATSKESPPPPPKPIESNAPNYAIDEINAYIAIRDGLLAEAEELRTQSKLDSVCIANDFVAGCLTPSRTPYEAQCLPKIDALRERERCEEIKARIAELRTHALP